MVLAFREAQPDFERSRQRTRAVALEAALQKGTPSPRGRRPGLPLCECVSQPSLLPAPGALAQLAPTFARAYFTNRNATTVLTCGYYVRFYCSFLLSSHQSCCSSAVVASALVQAGFHMMLCSCKASLSIARSAHYIPCCCAADFCKHASHTACSQTDLMLLCSCPCSVQ